MRVLIATLVLLLGFWTAQPAEGEQVDKDWSSGKEAARQGNWSKAARYFAAYRQNHPERAIGWAMEGYYRWLDEDSQAAVPLFEAALRLDPHQPDSLFYLADHDRQMGDVHQALDRLRRIERVPANLAASYDHLMGVLLVQTDQELQVAIEHLERVDLDEPSRVLLSVAYLRTGRRAEAESILAQLCPADPETPIRDAWIDCLDQDYCGELLDYRLEILRTLLAGPEADPEERGVVEATRVHLRHRECGSAVILETLASLEKRKPKACYLPLLRGLARSCDAEPESACGDFERASVCVESGGTTDLPVLDGPVIDPVTGAWLDLSRFQEVLGFLEDRHCK